MPHRHRVAPLLLAAAGLALPACSAPLPAGDPVTRVRGTADVTSVVLETSGDLVVTLGSTPRLEVTAGREVIDDLTSRADDGALHLGGSGVRGEVRYRLTTSSLASVAVRGSGTVRADLTGSPRPSIAVDGSGVVHADGLDAESVTTVLSGSGRVTLSGSAVTQTAVVEQAGEYAASELASESATVTVAGSGSAAVSITRTLDATVHGSGSITYAGDPRVEQHVDGSGEVSPP